MRKVPEEMATKMMAAADLFAERGLDGTKTEDIAAATGVPKATIYYYFEGKEEVLSFIFSAVLAAVGEAVEAALRSPGTAAERLSAVIDAHLHVFALHPKASQALHFDLGRAARLPEIRTQTNAAFIDPVASLLAQGARDGSLRAVGNPRLTAVAILGAVSTSAIHVLALDTGDPVLSLTRVITPLVLNGLRPEGGNQ